MSKGCVWARGDALSRSPGVRSSEVADMEDLGLERGRLHSIDTFTAVDGHGIRAIIFLQGCSKRCVFCCNPDSWSPAGGTLMTVAQVFRQIETSIPYYLSSGGGITLSGGECLLQPRFSKQLCVEARRRGLTAALDTAATGTERDWDQILPHVDLVLLCVKSSDPRKHQLITGSHDTRPYYAMLAFLAATQRHKVRTWIRFVLMSAKKEGADGGADATCCGGEKIPGHPCSRSFTFGDIATDDEAECKGVAAIAKAHSNVAGVEILPYHKFGVYKWEEMGLAYPLSGMETPSDEMLTRVTRLFEAEGIEVIG